MLIPFSLRHAQRAAAWLLITLDDDERQHAGNTGYDDDVRHVYRYDSLVPNFRNLREGDLALLRSDELIGIARIERIEETSGTKQLLRCPECGKTSLKARKHREPRYRCGSCGAETASPRVDIAPVTKYAAHFDETFVPTPRAIPIAALRAACQRFNAQLAMQEIALPSVAPQLAQVPGAAALLAASPTGGNERQRWVVIASDEHVDAALARSSSRWPFPTRARANAGDVVTVVRMGTDGAAIAARGRIEGESVVDLSDERDAAWWRVPVRAVQRGFEIDRCWTTVTWAERGLREPAAGVLTKVPWKPGDPPLWCLLSGETASIATAAHRANRPIVEEVPIEQMDVRSSLRQIEAHTKESVRREAMLVERFVAAMHSRGVCLVRHRITLPGTNAELLTDLFATGHNLLIEAKYTESREGVRMALAQLLDYRRFFEPRPRCAVLLPVRPSRDMEDLLTEHGVETFWEEGDGVFKCGPDGVLLELPILLA